MTAIPAGFKIEKEMKARGEKIMKMLEVWKKEKAGCLILLGDLLYHGPRNELPEEYAPKEVISLFDGNIIKEINI